MTITARWQRFAAVVLGAALAAVAVTRPAAAHCDTVDGPVVADARAALAAGEVTPVLKWVSAGDEAAIRDAFARTTAVRGGGEAARDLADTWFFETVVRIHRAGEGAPYDGLKPAGSVEPGIAAADRALASGDVDALIAALSGELTAGVRGRFARATAAAAHAEHHVAAGRAWVAAYVDLIHYVEGLHAALGGSAHGAATAAPAHAH